MWIESKLRKQLDLKEEETGSRAGGSSSWRHMEEVLNCREREIEGIIIIE